jgi:hypothetical protein
MTTLDTTLERCRFGGCPAWRWVAPNGTAFYLQQTYFGRAWVWWRSEADSVSSEPFASREALLAHLAQAFEED